MENRKEINILGINILYFITAVLLLTVGYYVQNKDVKTGLVITEYILVLLPPIIYIKLRGDSFKRVLRLNKLKTKHVFATILITILTYPIALFFNLIGMIFISILGTVEPPAIPTANSLSEYFILIVIIAMSAGLCEEVFFRGFVLSGYERFGKINGIVISAILFGLVHFNIQNLLGPIVLGIVFGFLVYETNSLFAGIVGHMTNNSIAVTLGYFFNLAKDKLSQQNINTTAQMPNTTSLIMVTLFMGIIATITGIGVYFLIKMIIKDTKNKQPNIYKENEEIEKYNKISFFVFTPILLTVIIFIYVAYSQFKYIVT